MSGETHMLSACSLQTPLMQFWADGSIFLMKMALRAKSAVLRLLLRIIISAGFSAGFSEGLSAGLNNVSFTFMTGDFNWPKPKEVRCLGRPLIDPQVGFGHGWEYPKRYF